MPKYKLIYFNSRGRAEPMRYMFAIAGQEYEDERIEGDKWHERKSEMPLGQLPVLEINGKKYPQSGAIMRHLAREFGLYGSTNDEALQVDVICDTVNDLILDMVKAFHMKDEAEKSKLMQEFVEKKVPKYFDALEKMLKENNSGDSYFIGDKVSVADIAVFIFIYDYLPSIAPGFKMDHQKLKALVERIEAIPNLAKWIKERPVTTR